MIQAADSGREVRDSTGSEPEELTRTPRCRCEELARGGGQGLQALRVTAYDGVCTREP